MDSFPVHIKATHQRAFGSVYEAITTKAEMSPRGKMAICNYSWEGAVSVGIDKNGKFQGEIEVPLEFLYGSGEDFCGADCSITLKFNP